MLPYRDSRFTMIALIVFFVVVALYALFEARGQILGPTISIKARTAIVHDQFISIEGTASRISKLTMNGRDISVTENGSFQEPYLLAAGYNRIVFDARDAYGRTTERVVEIVYVPNTASNAGATSSPSVVPAARPAQETHTNPAPAAAASTSSTSASAADQPPPPTASSSIPTSRPTVAPAH